MTQKKFFFDDNKKIDDNMVIIVIKLRRYNPCPIFFYLFTKILPVPITLSVVNEKHADGKYRLAIYHI